MKNFPKVIAQMPSLTSVNLSANPQWVDVDEGLRALASGPAGKSVQILYMNECSLTVLPKEINEMKKLGLLSVASNKISRIESAYPDISFVQLYLDNNQITEFPHYVSETGKKLFFCNDVYPKDAAGPKSVADVADIMLPHLGANTYEANFNAARKSAEQIVDYFEKGITTAVVNKSL